MDKVILHADINNFYASVAIKLNPALQNKPVIVCGDPEKRHGVVLAKSNIAKKHDIKTGDTVAEARRKCPGLIAVPPEYKQYTYFSNLIYNVYLQYTPYVESFGLDECWLDVTGCETEYGNGENLANVIRERIKKEIGLTVSIGVSFTKIFAKLGSDMKKPDAVTVIDRNNYKDTVWPLKVDDMLFVGKSIRNRLALRNVATIGDLARLGQNELQGMFGKVGQRLFEAANGIEDERVSAYNAVHVPESVSNGCTASSDISDIKSAETLIYSLCEVIAYRLRKSGLKAGGVSIGIRDSKLSSFTRQEMLSAATDNTKVIAEAAIKLLTNNYAFGENYTLRTITVGTYKLAAKEEIAQLSLFDAETDKDESLDTSVDNLRRRYGFGVLKRGIEMNETFTCDAREIDDGFLPFDKSKNTPDE